MDGAGVVARVDHAVARRRHDPGRAPERGRGRSRTGSRSRDRSWCRSRTRGRHRRDVDDALLDHRPAQGFDSEVGTTAGGARGVRTGGGEHPQRAVVARAPRPEPTPGGGGRPLPRTHRPARTSRSTRGDTSPWHDSGNASSDPCADHVGGVAFDRDRGRRTAGVAGPERVARVPSTPPGTPRRRLRPSRTPPPRGRRPPRARRRRWVRKRCRPRRQAGPVVGAARRRERVQAIGGHVDEVVVDAGPGHVTLPGDARPIGAGIRGGARGRERVHPSRRRTGVHGIVGDHRRRDRSVGHDAQPRRAARFAVAVAPTQGMSNTAAPGRC